MKAANLVFLEFAEAKQPIFKEVASREWITYGEDDDYPEYLLDLFNNSAKHNAIIKGKVNYIVGSGFDDTIPEDFTLNRNKESVDAVNVKIAMDKELFGGFYMEVIRLRGGGYEFYHTPYHKWRSNADNTKFYYNGTKSPWKTVKKSDVKSFPAWTPGTTAPKSIIYYKEYRPGIDVYTLPDYIGALNYIEADKEVGKHTLNNAKTGFTPSKIINLFNGEPTEEEQRSIERRFKNKFTGSDGFKFLLSFSSSPEKAPTVVDLGASDLTKEDFTVVNNLIQQEIFAGHQVTSPILFGIKTEGQLGGRSEMREAYEIFQNTYVNNKQEQLEKFWSMVLDMKDLMIERVEPLSYQFSESVIKDSISQEEVRSSFGKDPLVVDNPYAQGVVDALSKLPATLASRIASQLDAPTMAKLLDEKAPDPSTIETPPQEQAFSKEKEDAEVFSEFGDTKDGYVVVKKKKVGFSSDKEAMEDEAFMFQAFEVQLSDVEAKILDLIRKDKRITPEVIAETLGVDVGVVKNYIRDFTHKGILTTKTVTIGEDTIEEKVVSKPASEKVSEQKPSTTEIFIKYSYEGPKDERNRPFCAKLLELDRLYSRAEIEAISQRLGYSVWDRRGGWRTIKGTNQHVPFCRHTWNSNVVIKRK